MMVQMATKRYVQQISLILSMWNMCQPHPIVMLSLKENKITCIMQYAHHRTQSSIIDDSS